jgi:hypothetical protein
MLFKPVIDSLSQPYFLLVFHKKYLLFNQLLINLFIFFKINIEFTSAISCVFIYILGSIKFKVLY